MFPGVEAESGVERGGGNGDPVRPQARGLARGGADDQVDGGDPLAEILESFCPAERASSNCWGSSAVCSAERSFSSVW